MKKLAFLFLLQCSILCLTAQTDGKTERNRINKTIDSLNKEMERIFNANDMSGVAAFYSDDAEIIGANYAVRGRDNLDKYWLSLKDLGRGWKLAVIEIGGVGDFIYQLGRSDLTYIVNGKESKAVTNFIVLWKKQKDGSYKIFRDWLTDTDFMKPK